MFRINCVLLKNTSRLGNVNLDGATCVKSQVTRRVWNFFRCSKGVCSIRSSPQTCLADCESTDEFRTAVVLIGSYALSVRVFSSRVTHREGWLYSERWIRLKIKMVSLFDCKNCLNLTSKNSFLCCGNCWTAWNCFVLNLPILKMFFHCTDYPHSGYVQFFFCGHSFIVSQHQTI